MSEVSSAELKRRMRARTIAAAIPKQPPKSKPERPKEEAWRRDAPSWLVNLYDELGMLRADSERIESDPETKFGAMRHYHRGRCYGYSVAQGAIERALRIESNRRRWELGEDYPPAGTPPHGAT